VARRPSTANGPFPTEIVGPDQERLRELGGEYGTVTGRERRCGWLDLVGIRSPETPKTSVKLMLGRLWANIQKMAGADTKFEQFDFDGIVARTFGYTHDGSVRDREAIKAQIRKVSNPPGKIVGTWAEAGIGSDCGVRRVLKCLRNLVPIANLLSAGRVGPFLPQLARERNSQS